MANKVQLKKSSVAARVPLTTDVDYGELALNYADGKLYYKKSDGTTIDYFPSVAYVPLLSGSYANPTWITSLDASKLTGTIDNARLNGGTYSINITGNAGSASTLQTVRTINGTSFNGGSNINVTEWVHSDRHFSNGTLITTDINYAVTNGDPFVLEIRGNSYGNIIPLDLLYQGYIYYDTIINHGGISNGFNITGLVAINNGGNLCFWFPNQGYWQGYNVKVYVPYATRAVNRVTSITDVVKPTTAKQVDLSANIRQSLHSGNYTSYAQSTLVSGTNIKTVNGISLLGSGDLTVSASTADSAGYSTYNQILDTRAGQYLPNDYQDYRTTYEFTTQIVGGDWHTAMTMQGWHNGYAAWQIIGPASTSAHENWYLRSGINTSWNSARTILHSGNYSSYALPLSGGTISGALTAGEVYTNGWLRNNNSGTGIYNQATANHFYSDGQYWNVGYSGTTGIRLRNGHGGSVMGYLYGETSNNFGLLNAGGSWAVQVKPGGGGTLHGSWDGTNLRATRANGNFYIDDNYGNGVVGVYSSYRYQGVFAMGDSYKLPADGTSTGSLYGMAWAHPNAGGVSGNLDSHGLLVLINGGFGSAISYSIRASGNVTAYSDERLKTNWRDMPEDFVARLARVKVGIYDRTDGDKITQVGVGAQSFQQLLPEAISTSKDEMNTLSVNYGGAALASAVELAKDNVELRARIERLEILISKLIGE